MVFWTQAGKLGFRTEFWPQARELSRPRGQGKVGASEFLLGSLDPRPRAASELHEGSQHVAWLICEFPLYG